MDWISQLVPTFEQYTYISIQYNGKTEIILMVALEIV